MMNLIEQSDSRPFLIVIGSSAGGIDALRAFISGLPVDLDAPIVVAQHLASERESLLQQVLSFQSRLPVRTLDSNETLSSGTIYVIPASHDAKIVDAHAQLTIERRKTPTPSIDQLFISASEQYEDRVIAIILSGMGSDGIGGARAVKERGGTVFVQDPASASFATLPLAIPPTLIDIVARPEEMGALLARLLQGSQLPSGATEQNILHTLLLQLRDRSGIDFLQYKTPTIMRRLARLMVFSGTTSLPDYVRHLQANPAGYQKLIGAFLIKVTEFFRDPELFEELRVHHLPRLIEEARQRSGELRIWSAGTSTGEEAYSLAILCAEVMRDEAEAVPVRIFATDLDDEAITFARHGIYGREAIEALPPEIVTRYFVRMGDTYEVGKRIRSMTVFGQHDLAQRSPFPRIDLCVCRNVLIYFTRELQTRALQLFAFSLRDGGLLVLGKAESTSPLPQFFSALGSRQKIFERKGERNLIPPQRPQNFLSVTQDARAAIVAQPWLKTGLGTQRTIDRPSANEVVGGALFESAVGVVMIDRRYDILTINSAARTFFEIHGVGIGEDFVHLARHIDINRLRDVIDSAFRNENPEAIELQIFAEGSRTGRCLSIAPLHSDSYGRDGNVVLIVNDVTCSNDLRQTLQDQKAALERDVAGFTARIDEASRRLRTLHAANDELTVSNLDLRSANEQLMISAEESASSSEEVETLNEEMQATNEELETLNEELQATIEELNTTNDELAARSSELEDANREHVAEREIIRLEREALIEILELGGRPVAIVDEGGRLVHATRSLGRAEFFNEQGWWRKPNRVETADGRRYDTHPATIANATFPLTLVVFTLVNET